MSSSNCPKLDAVVDQAIAENRIVGTVVIVAKNGQIIYRRAAGWFDYEAGIAMPEDAVFRLASLTKPIVSAAALALIEKGIIGIDDPVTHYLPEFQLSLADGSKPTITIRQLLSHSAGLSYSLKNNSAYQKARISNGMDQPGLSMAENLLRIASVPLSYVPQNGWEYSVATDVLGEALARATRASLAEVVAEHVTMPLRMHDTGFVVYSPERLAVAYADGMPRPVRMGDRHSVSYDDCTIAYAPNRIFDSTSFQSGGAGMVGTADDFLVFLEALRLGGKPILSESSVRAMTTNVVGDLAVPALGPGWGFGLGASVVEDPALAQTPQGKGTWEWGGAYGHSWFVDPIQNLVVVALTNTAVAGMTGHYPMVIRDKLYEDLLLRGSAN